ncbi:sphingolipid delta(4)-desaturase DES1 [Lepeophtheirus salmonis]|uniref:sphingolipid 4-desaturase n=1 Tax=Lepeophtheirus salmonis TaxID=72036 RepID=C1BSH5_LEPSM|nr:sphingolipid delta(4)-desaturase DES1-like [Lepeophtheirus salmonis]ACO11978.1 Sphingolipid delta4-desaturase DES1 [Lepeophtheirus salmonis]
MGNHVTRTDFEWLDQEEPHAKRRVEILKKYPQIKKLFGVNPWFKFQVVFIVLIQILSFYLLKDQSWGLIIILAYVFGGVANHALMLAVHEIAHSAAFGVSYPLANRIFGIFANLPIGIPFAVSFKGYHLEHHRYQGHEVMDTDLPTELEAKLFCTTFGKFVWVCFQPLFYAIRPLVTNPKQPLKLEFLNTIVQLTFDFLVYYYLGGKIIFYMIFGSLMAMGFHPVAGHFISEHYMFKKGFETYSYYGPLNLVTFNVGYHNEHHDFPFIPGSRLPEVRKIAPEYYDTLPSHTSWVKVLSDFIFDPAIGPYARVKRKAAKEQLRKMKAQ